MLKFIEPNNSLVIAGSGESLRDVPKYLAILPTMELEPQSGGAFFARVNCSLTPWAPVALDVNDVHA